MNIKVNNPSGMVLLKELENMGVITIEKSVISEGFNGKQYRGIVPVSEKEKFKQYITTVRDEWERDI